MIRLATLIVLAATLAACSSEIEDAKKALADSIVIKTDMSVSDLRAYPGDVVCGKFTAYVSYHEPRMEDAPFIYRNGQIDRTPRPSDWKIFCNEDSATSLTAMTGFGPLTNDSAEWLAIIRDFGKITAALEAYYADNHFYPYNEQGLAALMEKPESKMPMPNYPEAGYLSAMPNDPWGRPYLYKAVQWGRNKGKVELLSLGRDGTPGGEGLDADVSSEYLSYFNHIIATL
ncbi:hypothetical protein BST95_13920 [Halioglobus japonicus]|uniref:Type II secretion system protein GspG C-terminal domain-containing protein n=1 Tax=Halioglobus japonicus TaxID=930805 RepID=A0AAP8MHA1_9GAMM|nr:type II secretion system protein GspG [Halioglobus japonicus]AQA19171.1 hypothetical protein BST95_13920 [Halioglobus japonicus]PLW87792.1 hypothetical protein C0029_04265 [Halioglobus japonicus]GHD06540.1 hypothetical protein GCM10007052_01400 [Halioglobus japonicus]